jgi:hypothetical protein
MPIAIQSKTNLKTSMYAKSVAWNPNTGLFGVTKANPL